MVEAERQVKTAEEPLQPVRQWGEMPVRRSPQIDAREGDFGAREGAQQADGGRALSEPLGLAHEEARPPISCFLGAVSDLRLQQGEQADPQGEQVGQTADLLLAPHKEGPDPQWAVFEQM